MRLPLPVSTYKLSNPQAGGQRLVNCFVEQAPKGNPKGPVLLRRAPGIRPWVEPNAGPVRGFTLMGDLLYFVSADELWSVDAAGTTAQVTGTVPGSERVRMSNNGTDIVIVRPSDNTGYSSDGATVSQIVDATFTGWGAADVDFIDGYFVFRRPGTAQVFNSGLNALTFSALDIFTAEGAPDELVGLIVDHRELFLPGRESCELWYDASNPSGSPFSRSPNGLLEIGSAASYSNGKQDNSVFWLANDLTFRRLNGLTPQRVSQYGIEDALAEFAVVSDCYALAYDQKGHEHIAFTFPNAGRTFVYDTSTREWHERSSLGYGRWRPNAIAHAFGLQIVGDSASGKVGILDPNTRDEWGDPQRVEWTYQTVYADHQRASHERLEIIVNAGSGVTSGQGEDPLITLYKSDDGGMTFRALPTRSLGRLGEYKTRAYWWRLGSSRDRVYRAALTDPVALFVLDTQLHGNGLRL